jgi:hypothetical protein
LVIALPLSLIGEIYGNRDGRGNRRGALVEQCSQIGVLSFLEDTARSAAENFIGDKCFESPPVGAISIGWCGLSSNREVSKRWLSARRQGCEHGMHIFSGQDAAAKDCPVIATMRR